MPVDPVRVDDPDVAVARRARPGRRTRAPAARPTTARTGAPSESNASGSGRGQHRPQVGEVGQAVRGRVERQRTAGRPWSWPMVRRGRAARDWPSSDPAAVADRRPRRAAAVGPDPRSASPEDSCPCLVRPVPTTSIACASRPTRALARRPLGRRHAADRRPGLRRLPARPVARARRRRRRRSGATAADAGRQRTTRTPGSRPTGGHSPSCPTVGRSSRRSPNRRKDRRIARTRHAGPPAAARRAGRGAPPDRPAARRRGRSPGRPTAAGSSSTSTLGRRHRTTRTPSAGRGLASPPRPGEPPDSDYRFIDRLGYMLNGAGFLYDKVDHLWLVDATTGDATRLTDGPVARRRAGLVAGRHAHRVRRRTDDATTTCRASRTSTSSTSRTRRRSRRSPAARRSVFGIPTWMPDGRTIAALGHELEGRRGEPQRHLAVRRPTAPTPAREGRPEPVAPGTT